MKKKRKCAVVFKYFRNKWKILWYLPIEMTVCVCFLFWFDLVNVTLPLCAQDDVACALPHLHRQHSRFQASDRHTHFGSSEISQRPLLLCRCSSAVLWAFIVKNLNGEADVDWCLGGCYSIQSWTLTCNLSQTFVWRQKTSGSALSCRLSPHSLFMWCYFHHMMFVTVGWKHDFWQDPSFSSLHMCTCDFSHWTAVRLKTKHT